MKSRISYGLFLAVLMLVGFPNHEVFAQLGFVSGTVVDENGAPVKDATVRIEAMAGSRKYRVKTNDKGQYVHAGISLQGTYRVIVEKEGFQGDYIEGVKAGFTRDDERSVRDFTLKRGEARRMAFEMSDEELARLKERQEAQKKQAEALEAVRESFNQGVTLYNAGEYAQAIKQFEIVLEADPTQATVWSNVGACYMRLNEHEKALAAYDKAIELEPTEASHFQNKGSVYAAMGDSDKAREFYEKSASMSAELSPKDAAINYYNMGVTYINSGQTAEAAEALKKAVELDPSHAEAHYQLGITLLGLNDMEAAMEELKTYLKLAPNSPNAEVAKALIEQLGG